MKRFGFLIFLISCSGEKPTPPMLQTPPAKPTIVNAAIGFDCSTQLAATGEASMSDGTSKEVKVYPANSDGSSPPITCEDGFSVFSLNNCNDTAVGYFCLPSSFTCNYLPPDSGGTMELCNIPPS